LAIAQALRACGGDDLIDERGAVGFPRHNLGDFGD
jgi:hypothetical protein